MCSFFLKLNVLVLVIRHLVDKKDEGERMIHTRAEHRTGGPVL